MGRTDGIDGWKIVLGIFAVSNLANGIWMLVGPAHWYFNLPAGVPGTGPLNEHFIRDIGCVFLLMGGGLAFAAVRPAHRVFVMFAVTSWYALHAGVHVFDTLRGLLGPEYWLTDATGVYAPTILLAILTAIIWRSQKIET